MSIRVDDGVSDVMQPWAPEAVATETDGHGHGS